MDEKLTTKIIEFSYQVRHCESLVELNYLVETFKDSENPYFYQMAGLWCLINKRPIEALPWFEKAILLGIECPNKYWDTQLADSIGATITKILTLYKSELLNDEITKLFAIGYCYLSNTIHQLGVKAFESLESRADLILYTNHDITSSFIPMGIIKQVYAVSDYYGASEGLRIKGYDSEAQEKLNHAKKLYDWIGDISINGKVGYSYELQEIVNIGLERHRMLYEPLKQSLFNNKFALSEKDVKKIIESLTPR